VELAVYTTDSPEAQTRYAGMVYHELDRMVSMTQDLLEFASGRTRLARTRTNLNQFLRDVVAGWCGVAEKESVTVTLKSSDVVMAAIDPAKIHRALDNIFTNAMEVLGPGGAIAVQISSDSETARIAISDTGPGIPDEIRDSLFEPFATSGKDLGTGLGLAVARKAIEDHGGVIRAHSEPGTGTTFEIELPLGLPSPAADGNEAALKNEETHHETLSA
jgi:signal transduction histidine kinase